VIILPLNRECAIDHAVSVTG